MSFTMNEEISYTALILAAGIGSRISDLTNKPKCLLKVNGKTILERHLISLINCGVQKVVIVTGYKDRLVREVALRFSDEIEIDFIFNIYYDVMGNTYSLSCGLNVIQTPILVFDADLMYEQSILKEFINSKVPNEVLVGECSIEDIECSKVLIDEKNIIRQFADKREVTRKERSMYDMTGEALGVLKFSQSFAEELTRACNLFLSFPENQKTNWESLLNYFISDHSLYIHHAICNKWIEIDTKEDFEMANRIFSEQQIQNGEVWKRKCY